MFWIPTLFFGSVAALSTSAYFFARWLRLRRDARSIARAIEASNAAIVAAQNAAAYRQFMAQLTFHINSALSSPAASLPMSGAADFEGHGGTESLVYGLRNWNIDALGRLHGKVFKNAIWTAGENAAKCLAYRQISLSEAEIAEIPAPDHDVTTCKHGFYAYYDGSRDYHSLGDVTGVIKGWGKAEVGDRGFRSEKAEIVAIMFDESVDNETRDLVCRRYPDAAVFGSLEQMLAECPLTAAGLEDNVPVVPELED